MEIGEDHNIVPDEHQHDGVKIKILSPTDCVKDRLASYIHFNARECLDQAVLVAKNHLIKLKNVKEWCRREGYPDTFDNFLSRLKEMRKN